MKRKILIYSVLFFVTLIHGQKHYAFDYALEYNFQLNETSEINKVYLLTNSNDNSYYIYAEESKEGKEGKLNVRFKDTKGFFSMFSIQKEDAFNSLPIKLSFELVNKQNFSKENNLERYVFQINKDTIIQNKKHKLHTLNYKKKYDSKAYDKGFAYYVVEENTAFHMPLLLFSSSFDDTLINKEIPNGIPKLLYTTNREGNKNKFIYKLVSYTKIDKELVIPKKCLE